MMESHWMRNSQPDKKERKKRNRKQREEPRLPQNEIFNAEDNVYNLNWSTPLINAHRVLPNAESAFSPFPVPVAYPVDSYQYSMFSMCPNPATQSYYPVPPTRKGKRVNAAKVKHVKKQSSVPEQDFASLPPTNCDAFSEKSSDSDNSKRHFSDPGVGPASSDESFQSWVSASNPVYINLVEEIQHLKENNTRMANDMTFLKQEIIELKSIGCPNCNNQPGTLTDTIAQLRKATADREDSLLCKLEVEIQAAASRNNQELEALSQRLAALESKFDQLETNKRTKCEIKEAGNYTKLTSNESKADGVEKIAETEAPDAFRMLRELEQEKSQLEQDLQKAVADRSEAEANTHKLERLVAILRAKINGLSSEICVAEDHDRATAPKIFDKNPFIVMDSAGRTCTKVLVDKTECSVVPTQVKTVANLTTKAVSQPNGSKLSVSPTVPTKPPNLSLLPKPTHPLFPGKPSNNVQVLAKTSPTQVVKRIMSDKINANTKEEIMLLADTNSNQTSLIKTCNVAVSDVRSKENELESESETSSENSSLPTLSLGGTITMTGPVTHL